MTLVLGQNGGEMLSEQRPVGLIGAEHPLLSCMLVIRGIYLVI